MKTPSIVIAGTNSGCGKTTVSMGIMAALVKRGMKVQPFKVGPDYIDPMFHTFITGRDSRNLDSWLLDEDTVRYLFKKNSLDSDIAIIEGVMGFFDGYGGKSIEGSTAHVAQIIGAPVVLVINGEAMSLSAAAIVKGFADFDRTVNIKGVIINNISGERHYQILKEAIERHTGISVLGYLKRESEINLESRHLGLVTSSEVDTLKEKVDLLAAMIEKTIDIDLLLKLSKESNEIAANEIIIEPVGKPRIAVALDRAFNFYYKDNIDLIKMLGAEIEYFSPISDKKLPQNIDGLYMGGGYPEVWAKELQNNLSMRQDIKKHIEAGLPTYAECGGFMYLTDSLQDKYGNEYDMTGIIPGGCQMTNSLKRFGYVYVKITEDNILAKAGAEIRAHEFHFSEANIKETVTTCYNVSKNNDSSDGKSWTCGFKVNNLLAGYAHMHFWANTEFARGFIKNCSDLNSSKVIFK